MDSGGLGGVFVRSLFQRLPTQLGVLALLSGTAFASEEQICRGGHTAISVWSEDAMLAENACKAVSEAIGQLEDCGLSQSGPIRIDLRNDVIDDQANCLGVYHCESDNIGVLTPDAMSGMLPKDSPLRAIPVERLFSSIITHELAHAFLYQMRSGSGETIAEDEYVAYAMQYLSLSETERMALLDAMPGHTRVVTRDMLNDLFLTMSPVVYGSWAWRHFAKQEDRCGFIAGIVAGEIDFSVDAASRCLDPPECTIMR